MKKNKLIIILVSILLILIASLVGVIIYDVTRGIAFENKMQLKFDEFHVNKEAVVDDNNVIGTIEIPKIDLSYPIIDYVNDSSLDIAINKFYGPEINTFGNVVLAGHNNRNRTSFNRINELKKGDIIILTDKSGKKIDYIINSKYITTNENDKVLSQDTNKRKVTLITCYVNNIKWLIVDAYEKED